MKKLTRPLAQLLSTAALAFSLAAPANAAAPLPEADNKKHLGVATCSGSTCHGKVRPSRTYTVLQNEYTTWSRHDDHAKAYQTLLTPESQNIAANMGLPNAHEAKICLDCHADNVPRPQRGTEFQLSDGVGCEACHGGAEKWLGIHINGRANHSANIRAGLFPTEVPAERNRLCQSCHLGTKDKFATHKIMGAGHPRLSFELETFTQIQPKHYKVDRDYTRRKINPPAIKVWAIGQVDSGVRMLALLEGPLFQEHLGMFPELSFFDCQACHHKMDNIRWNPRSSLSLGPGKVHLNDGHLLMAQVIAEQLAPDLSGTMAAQLRDLHAASQQSRAAVKTAAQALHQSLQDLQRTVINHRFTKGEIRSMLNQMIDTGLRGEYQDYIAAEQATMAIQIMTSELGQAKLWQLDVDSLYKLVNDDDDYEPTQFTSALRKLRAAIGG